MLVDANQVPEGAGTAPPDRDAAGEEGEAEATPLEGEAASAPGVVVFRTTRNVHGGS